MVRFMKWNLPNILTVLRLLAAPGVAIMFLYFSRPHADWLALLLFLSAAIPDFFDGYLARTSPAQMQTRIDRDIPSGGEGGGPPPPLRRGDETSLSSSGCVQCLLVIFVVNVGTACG